MSGEVVALKKVPLKRLEDGISEATIRNKAMAYRIQDSFRPMRLNIHRVISTILLGALEVTANLYCNFVTLYWEGCVICRIYLR